MTNIDSILKSRDITLPNKGPSSQGYGFSSSHVWLWELDNKKSWAQKNWCFWTMVLDKTLESPLDFKEIKPINPQENQSWILSGRTDAETEAPMLWPPDAKNWLIRKRPWCRERLKAGGEGDDRGWDGWMASSTQWTWVWVSFRSWWWTGKPGILQSIGLQSWTQLSYWTKLNWTHSHLQIHALECPYYQTDKNPAPPNKGQTSVPPSPQGSLHKTLRPALHTRKQTPEVRGTTILKLGAQKVKQNEMAGEYGPDERIR